MNRCICLSFLLVSGLAVLVGCAPKPAQEEQKAFMLSDTMMHRIRLDSTVMQPVRSELTLVGKVVADENRVIKVFPLVGGNVEDVKVELGDYVRKGQTLALIRSGEVADIERQGIQAQSDLLLAEKNLRVAQDMFETKLVSQREVVAAQKEVEKAQAEANRVKEVARIYGLGKTSIYTVKAPIDGYVIEKNVNRGMQLRSDNADNLFTIGQISEVWVLANVNESDIGRVRIGMDASIQTLSYPDQLFKGQVDKMYTVLDPGTKAMTVRIRLTNTGLKLRPEMHATVTLRYEDGGKLATIPAGSVIFDQSKHFVMVFKSRSDIETREVNVLKTIGDIAYIKTGLKPGERVISQNQLLVYDAIND
ncbi:MULTISPECIES: efflux RND transporter periplasmic adaptor subunit [unclassified Spirosoma]|uniref:efflux RND transporter periplasmic adaptor subunit n=1 Tax=unclassified Spirosoma TaxID=2621999 RepID=UPI0009620118|nr:MULTISPECIES: efflux RND transporter periplasmic adaptor subunit [unclassified Spirosoma]MBN8825794.1 efflux RND transporter periplasmic adaptor subunit [Spirosoma sp.]OJW74386.1 MAG: efflux transporter periplasmic adaptor subunit [Spirosoma sp. 48-14]